MPSSSSSSSSSASLFLTLLTLASTALAGPTWRPFQIPSLTTHQPNGNPDGQTNYYHLIFNLSSTNSHSLQTGHCWASWGDNSWAQPQAYSVEAPTGEWLQCDAPGADLGAGGSVFSFKLFEYFSIGNFSLEVREELWGNETSLYGWAHITNQTTLACDIQGAEVKYLQHAHGDCNLAQGQAPFYVAALPWEWKGWY